MRTSRRTVSSPTPLLSSPPPPGAIALHLLLLVFAALSSSHPVASALIPLSVVSAPPPRPSRGRPAFLAPPPVVERVDEVTDASPIEAPVDDESPSSGARRSCSEFFEEQLTICRRVAASDAEAVGDSGSHQDDESGRAGGRFHEHPRCTARFGEVLRHALDSSSASPYERRAAVHNARSVVVYVDAHLSGGSAPIRLGLVDDVASSLRSRSLRDFRARQLADAPAPSVDFAPEDADAEAMGRLYYSAITRTTRYLDEVGLSRDHGGFTTLLALCRATVSPLVNNGEAIYFGEEAILDSALSDHFNGILAPGRRFLFSPLHGLPADVAGPRQGRAGTLVVAFSSLGNGLVRHEFGGSLAKINNQLLQPHDDDERVEDRTFDVLFIADPSQSWYSKDSRGGGCGFDEYVRRIHIASRPYERVCMVGDSMGGSAALLFSHLARGGAVVAFAPQVDLCSDSHVGRYDMTPRVREEFHDRIVGSVGRALQGGIRVTIHRGVESADVRHTDHLVNELSKMVWGSRGVADGLRKLRVVEHADCKHHQVATYLKGRGEVTGVLYADLVLRCGTLSN